MTSMMHKTNGTSFASFAYAYNSVGHRTSRAETNNVTGITDTYTYDATDQVSGVNYNASTRVVAYQWDAVGNRVSVTNNGVATNYTANSLNQYTAVGGDSPTYDNRGNLTTQNAWTYTYDAQNRLLTATNNTTTASFGYDALNRCVSRTINGITTLFIYDNWNLIEEWTTGGAQVAHYVHGPRMDEILVKVSATNAVYYHHDALGNVTHLTGTNGVVVEKYTYEIFGAVTIKDGSGNTLGGTAYANRFLFTGREWLADVSLYDYRNRIYSQELGRFLQTDPIRFKGGDVDLYRYVANNPINVHDPDGLLFGGFNCVRSQCLASLADAESKCKAAAVWGGVIITVGVSVGCAVACAGSNVFYAFCVSWCVQTLAIPLGTTWGVYGLVGCEFGKNFGHAMCERCRNQN